MSNNISRGQIIEEGKMIIYMVKLKERIDKKIINDRILKAIFISNKNILAKLISDLTDIEYVYIKDNIKLKVNEIPITYKDEKFKKCDFIVDIDDTTINIEANSSYYKGEISKNLSYVFSLYGRGINVGKSYNDDKIVIQINLNAYGNKNKNEKHLVDYMLRDNEGQAYVDNFKILNLDIVKCFDMYYNESELKDLSNSTKWGAFLWSNYDDKNVCKILEDVLDNDCMNELKSILEGINMNLDENGLMTEEEAIKWGKWIGNSMVNHAKEEVRDEVKEEVRDEVKEEVRDELEEEIIINTIKSMLENKVDYELISKVTNKTIEEIRKIEESMKA